MVVGMTVRSAMSVSATLRNEGSFQFFNISAKQVQQALHNMIFLYQEVVTSNLAWV